MPLMLVLLGACYLGGTCDPCVDTLEIAVYDDAGEPVDTFSGEVQLGAETVAFSCTDGAAGEDEYTCQGNTVVFSTSETPGELEVDDPEGNTFAGSPEVEDGELGNGDCGYCAVQVVEVELEGCGDCG